MILVKEVYKREGDSHAEMLAMDLETLSNGRWCHHSGFWQEATPFFLEARDRVPSPHKQSWQNWDNRFGNSTGEDLLLLRNYSLVIFSIAEDFTHPQLPTRILIVFLVSLKRTWVERTVTLTVILLSTLLKQLNSLKNFLFHVLHTNQQTVMFLGKHTRISDSRN